MLQLPLTQYQTQGDLANAANVGMTTLDALFNGYRQHDESEMRFKALQDAEELLKQRRLETVPKQLEAMLAEAKMDPELGYIKSNIEGYKGQMNSQIAAGKKAMQTVDGEIGTTNAENKNKAIQLELVKRFLEMKQRPGGAGQPAPQQGGSIGLPIAGKPGKTQPMNANNSKLQALAPLRNGGVNLGDAEYEAAMNALVDTPELRTKLIMGDQKADSAEYMQMLKLQALMAKAQAGKGERDPRTAQEAIVQFWKRELAEGRITPEQYLQETSGVLNRVSDKPQQPGVAAQVNPDGTIKLDNKRPQEPYVPGKGNKPRGTGTKDDPIKLD